MPATSSRRAPIKRLRRSPSKPVRQKARTTNRRRAVGMKQTRRRVTPGTRVYR